MKCVLKSLHNHLFKMKQDNENQINIQRILEKVLYINKHETVIALNAYSNGMILALHYNFKLVCVFIEIIYSIL